MVGDSMTSTPRSRSSRVSVRGPDSASARYCCSTGTIAPTRPSSGDPAAKGLKCGSAAETVPAPVTVCMTSIEPSGVMYTMRWPAVAPSTAIVSTGATRKVVIAAPVRASKARRS